MKRQSPYSYSLSCLALWLEFRARHMEIPGLSVTIRAEGKTLFTQTYGLADNEACIPLGSSHMFNVASHTKMFTAVAIFLLLQDGKLKLDDPAVTYLPWLKRGGDKGLMAITLRQLLCHRAGLLRDGENADYWAAGQSYPDKAAVRRMVLNDRLALRPNSALKYSNVAYTLLGEVVEAVGGQSFAAYISERIIRPLELTATMFDEGAISPDRMVTGYGHMFERQYIPVGQARPPQGFAAVTGMYSTTEDMARFMDVHLYEGLLTTQSQQEMQRLQARVDDGYDAGMEFGLGLEIHHSTSGRLIGHSGHAVGNVTATFTDIARKLTVSVAANAKDTPIQQIVLGIFEFLDAFEEPVDETAKRFNALLCNTFSTVAVFASADTFIAFDPDDWSPLAFYDTLVLKGEQTLGFATEGSAYHAGEALVYEFSKNGTLSRVRLAGSLFWPEEAFRKGGYRASLPG